MFFYSKNIFEEEFYFFIFVFFNNFDLRNKKLNHTPLFFYIKKK